MDEFDEKNEEKTETKTERSKPQKTSKDDEAIRKVVFCLCYLWGILFFIPLIMYKDDVAKMHANEGLLLLLFSIVGNAVFGGLTQISIIFGWIAGVYSALLLVLGIIGIVYVVTDNNKPLPIIGGIKLIK